MYGFSVGRGGSGGGEVVARDVGPIGGGEGVGEEAGRWVDGAGLGGDMAGGGVRCQNLEVLGVLRREGRGFISRACSRVRLSGEWEADRPRRREREVLSFRLGRPRDVAMVFDLRGISVVPWAAKV